MYINGSVGLRVWKIDNKNVHHYKSKKGNDVKGISTISCGKWKDTTTQREEASIKQKRITRPNHDK
jgi:hypothetical protein